VSESAGSLGGPAAGSADLAKLPADPAAGPPSELALSDTAVQARYKGLANALPGGLAPRG